MVYVHVSGVDLRILRRVVLYGRNSSRGGGGGRVHASSRVFSYTEKQNTTEGG